MEEKGKEPVVQTKKVEEKVEKPEHEEVEGFSKIEMKTKTIEKKGKTATPKDPAQHKQKILIKPEVEKKEAKKDEAQPTVGESQPLQKVIDAAPLITDCYQTVEDFWKGNSLVKWIPKKKKPAREPREFKAEKEGNEENHKSQPFERKEKKEKTEKSEKAEKVEKEVPVMKEVVIENSKTWQASSGVVSKVSDEKFPTFGTKAKPKPKPKNEKVHLDESTEAGYVVVKTEQDVKK